MKAKELHDALIRKNEFIKRQAKRISLLEEKLAESRQRYFGLKYDAKKARVHS